MENIVMRKAPNIRNEKVRTILEKCKLDPELSIFLRDNYYSVYCKGLVFATIKPQSIAMSDSVKKKLRPKTPAIEYYEQRFDLIKEVVKQGMKNDIERERQQIISSNNDSEGMAVCDFEYAIKKEYMNNDCKPEIDIVAVDNSQNPMIYIIEYKCTPAALKEPRGVVGHYLDFVRIKESSTFPDFINSIIVSYNTLVNEAIIKNQSIAPISTKRVKFAYLFTDLDKSTYIPYLRKVVDQKKNLPVLVAHFDDHKAVKLSSAAFVPIEEFIKENDRSK